LKQQSPRTSDLLAGVAAAHGEGDVAIGALVEGLRNRAFGLSLLLFGIPNCLPLPPGVPVVCGGVLAFLGAQLMLGRSAPWLPRRLAERTIPASVLAAVVTRALPWVRRFERLSRPRLARLAGSTAHRIVGLVVMLLAGVLILPIPFLGNMPPGVAISILGLALVERDGLLVLAGFVAALLGVGVTVGATWAVVASAGALF
jgi:hypothetical protein